MNLLVLQYQLLEIRAWKKRYFFCTISLQCSQFEVFQFDCAIFTADFDQNLKPKSVQFVQQIKKFMDLNAIKKYVFQYSLLLRVKYIAYYSKSNLNNYGNILIHSYSYITTFLFTDLLKSKILQRKHDLERIQIFKKKIKSDQS